MSSLMFPGARQAEPCIVNDLPKNGIVRAPSEYVLRCSPMTLITADEDIPLGQVIGMRRQKHRPRKTLGGPELSPGLPVSIT